MFFYIWIHWFQFVGDAPACDAETGFEPRGPHDEYYAYLSSAAETGALDKPKLFR